MSVAGFVHICASVLVSAGMLLSSQGAFAREAGTVVDGRAILKMGKGSDLCALTFDDGPGPHTERLMGILRERGIRATFFLVGKQIGYYPDLVVRLQQEGHEIGNHTQSHRSLRDLPQEEQRAEIVSVQDTLRKLGAPAGTSGLLTGNMTPVLWISRAQRVRTSCCGPSTAWIGPARRASKR